ncbi:hypothetical protein RM572_04870 [Streptomyces sp. DSM 42041]|uniref:Nuclear transport factor 2 family protein n=1 Tax=Streptomyces hazeniae TaxID=3075538 RepID=A0ABU2NR57_9ACTN|nr:hypothetical protein [Streptomyces sp. DSM 42041]MDT0378108.1 hypothetical protein [Streptomyces sp. DSM 42041]
MSDRASEPAGPADGGAGGEGSSVPDGAWEAFQREAEESGRRGSAGAAGVPKEPSARARMVAARLREQDEAAAAAQRRGLGRRGKGKKPPEPWQPDGWRTGPALYERRGGGGWRQSRRVGLVFAVLCLLVGGLWFADQRGHLNLGSPGSGAQGEPLAAETGRPTGAPPTAAFSGLPTLERPWAGSPARRWDEGADAIELPAAEPVGDVSAAALADALADVKDFLVASQLDRETLHGAGPERALELLDPKNADHLRTVREGLRAPSAGNDGSALFTRFDGDELRLVGDAVKVRGRISVEEGEQGRAVVRTDHSFVYALRRAGDDEVTRVVVRRAFAFDVAPAGWGTTTPGTVWVTETIGEWAGVRCDAEADGMLHPGFPSERADGGGDGPTRDPYDRSREAGTGGADPAACGTATRV